MVLPYTCRVSSGSKHLRRVPVGHYIYVRNKKTKAGQPGHWDDKKRLEVLTTFVATGSQAHTSAITKVPEETIRVWRKQDWWIDQMREMQQDNTLELGNRLTKVMDKALDAVVDRIENGEFMYDPRTGEIRRVPAKLRDLQKVAVDSIDRKLLLTKANKDKQEAKQQITADHLLMLAREFAKFATGKVPDESKDVTSVIDGEHTEVFESLGMEVSKPLPIKDV